MVAERRRYANGAFAGGGQQDAVEFMERFLDSARSEEFARGRYGLWGGVQLDRPVAPHVERLFGFVEEARRRCLVCRGPVRAWYSSERVLRVTPFELPGGPCTVTEMYLASCKAQEEAMP